MASGGPVIGLTVGTSSFEAVQCHAEELGALPWARRLFRTFINSARD